MADVFAYLYGFGAGGDFTKSVIIVTAPTGSTVTCSKGTTVKTATEKNGEWWFKNLDIGTWTLKATLSGQTATQIVNITQFGVYRITMSYSDIPSFTYTGGYKVVDDNWSEIQNVNGYKGNWNIMFLTSGIFTLNSLGSISSSIDLFIVGGGGGGGTPSNSWIGGGGGGGGYYATHRVSVATNTPYEITIGSGGASDKNGGATSAFNKTVNGGFAGGGKDGGSGGSGGGGGGYSKSASPGSGGSNGGSGTGMSDGGYSSSGGTGSEVVSKAFGGSTGTQYAAGGGGGAGISSDGKATAGGSGGVYGGGNGGSKSAGSPAIANTGSGGGGGGRSSGMVYNGGSGGSGIVIIRNAR